MNRDVNLVPIHATRVGGGAPVEMLAAAILTPEPWVKEALCAETDPDMYFPERGGSGKDAKKVCAECPVRMQCLEYALRTGQTTGVWGGLSERDRRKFRHHPSGGQSQLTPTVARQLTALVEEHLPDTTIAARLGFSARTISNYRAQLGLPGTRAAS